MSCKALHGSAVIAMVFVGLVLLIPVETINHVKDGKVISVWSAGLRMS